MAVVRLRRIEELPAMLTVEQVRQVLGISRPIAYQLANRNDFPAIRIGRAIRIPKEAFISWVESQLRHDAGKPGSRTAP